MLLLVSTPIFYFAIQGLFIHNMDRELVSHKTEFHELLPLLRTDADLRFFSLMNDEMILRESEELMKVDSFFYSRCFQ